MFDAIATGFLLGLTSGIAPGPLLALVLAQTLRYGPREGVKIALVPLITDGPIIALSLLLSAKLQSLHAALGVMSLLGAAYVIYLAWESLNPPAIDTNAAPTDSHSWRKGIVTNLLSPSPWLFWFTVGAVSLSKAWPSGWLAPALLLIIFYVLLCGSKLAVVALAARSRGAISGPAHRRVLQGLGIVLLAFAAILICDGLRYLAVV